MRSLVCIDMLARYSERHSYSVTAQRTVLINMFPMLFDLVSDVADVVDSINVKR